MRPRHDLVSQQERARPAGGLDDGEFLLQALLVHRMINAEPAREPAEAPTPQSLV